MSSARECLSSRQEDIFEEMSIRGQHTEP